MRAATVVTVGRVARGVLLAALAVLPAGVALADAARPIDPAVSRYERAVRRIEGRAGADPTGAAREAGRFRRQLTTESGGVSFTPDRARLDRRLGELQAQAPAAGDQPVRVPADGVDRNEPLPSSYATEEDELPSLRREMGLASRLLDRAAAGVGARDGAQATSDLSTAESSLAGLEGVAPEAELKPLRDRASDLREKIAALPPEAADQGATNGGAPR